MSFASDVRSQGNRPQYIAEIDIQDGGVVLEAFNFPRVTTVAYTTSPGYALVDAFESAAGWSATDGAANIATSATKVEGSNSISFDKTSTATDKAGIIKTVSLNLSAIQRWRITVHIPSAEVLAKLSSIRLRLDESAGAFTTTSDFTLAATKLAVGWNWVAFSPNRPIAVTGTPTRATINRLAFDVTTLGATDTVAGIKVDDFCTLDYGFVAVGDASYPQGIHEYSTSGESALSVDKAGTAVTSGIEFPLGLDATIYDAIGFDVRVPDAAGIVSVNLKMFNTAGGWGVWTYTRPFTAGWNSPKFDIGALPVSSSGSRVMQEVNKVQLYLTYDLASREAVEIVFDRMVGWIGPSYITSHPVSDLGMNISLQGALSIPGTVSQKAQPELGKTELSGVSFTVVDRKMVFANLSRLSTYTQIYACDVEPPAADPAWVLTGVDHATVV